MSRVTQYFQPPLYWQQFEDLTEGVFKFTFDDAKPQKVGRPGQSQDGVDVYGRFRKQVIGIQCKRMDERDENNHPLPGGVITRKFIDGAINEMRYFKPKLDIFILATTAKRDSGAQEYARELDDEFRARNAFGVQLWFWDDFVTDLNRHYELQRWYYDQVIQVRSPDDQDILILEMLREAFARAAFRSPLHHESPTEFLQALKDTQCAMKTGQLKDRETRRVIRQAIGGRQAIACRTVRDKLGEADQNLQKLREVFQENLGSKITTSGSFLIIQPSLLMELNDFRANAIAAVNGALRLHGLDSI
jgi:hypothetical protein